MALGFIDWLSGSCEVLFPRECLVCTRPLRGRSLCFRCAPPPPTLTTTRCKRCFGPIPYSDGDSPTVICETCLTFPPLPCSMRYLWEYSGKTRDLIRAMKYQPSVYLTTYCAQILKSWIPQMFEEPSWDVIVPIPSSPKMLKKRLFHPCFEMAKIVAQGDQAPKVVRALRHNTKRSPQATLTHDERLRGLRSFFTVQRPERFRGRRVLLVEDVITTGATISAASYALYEAGAARVDVVALAQAQIWSRFRARLHRVFQKSPAAKRM